MDDYWVVVRSKTVPVRLPQRRVAFDKRGLDVAER